MILTKAEMKTIMFIHGQYKDFYMNKTWSDELWEKDGCVTDKQKKNVFHGVLIKEKFTVNNYWNTVIFSDESQIVLGEKYRAYVWRTSKEAYLSQCMCPLRQRRVSIMVWGCITYYGVGTLCLVKGNINAEKYISILENHLCSVIAQHLATTRTGFKMTMPPYIESILRGTTNWKIIFQLLCGRHIP